MKTYIINVSTNAVRKKHMLDLISAHPCLKEYSFVQRGDISELSDEVMKNYFAGELATKGPATSCAYKHLLAYEALRDDPDSNFALVLEDDIFFNARFCQQLQQLTNEIHDRRLENFIISLEDSNLKYVKGSQRRKNQLLYKAKKGRMAGAYLIDKKAAKAILNKISSDKCHLPIDWYHNYCADYGLIDLYWAHPTLACQGSLNGKLQSTIDDKTFGRWKILKFNMSRVYKRLLYSLR